MSHNLKTQTRRTASRRASLRQHRSSRTVLLQMAHDEARAERVRELKNQRPDLTWRRIADAVGVSERSAFEWQKSGGMEHANAVKLAEVFEVDADWLWSGRVPGETPDLMAALNSRSDLAQLAESIGELHAKMDRLLDAVGAKPSGGALGTQMQRMVEQVEAALSPPPRPTAKTTGPAGRSRRTRPEPATKD